MERRIAEDRERITGRLWEAVNPLNGKISPNQRFDCSNSSLKTRSGIW
jgi:hypothetical protein